MGNLSIHSAFTLERENTVERDSRLTISASQTYGHPYFYCIVPLYVNTIHVITAARAAIGCGCLSVCFLNYFI